MRPGRYPKFKVGDRVEIPATYYRNAIRGRVHEVYPDHCSYYPDRLFVEDDKHPITAGATITVMTDASRVCPL